LSALHNRATTALAVVSLALAACRGAESPEVVRDRSRQQFLQNQIASLQQLVAKAERGEVATVDQIAIGLDEKVAKDLMNAPLPRELTIEKRLLLRIESVQPFFRGNQAGVLFRARASSVAAPGAFAAVEMGGRLDSFELKQGRLTARVKIEHFVLLDSSVGSLGRGVVEGLVRSNMTAIEAVIPPVEIPVRLEEAVHVSGAQMGPVTVVPGDLPLAISVAHVIPVNERLWVLLDASAGPWKAGASEP